ncbi:MAG: glycosyltransferase, partial [Acidobacteriaceae bacterium]|nr:glycosyltransferase [Acidobacteriaceae bacterium]
MIVDKEGAILSLDTPEPVLLSGREAYIRGWFLPRKGVEKTQQLVVTLDGLEIPVAFGLPRRDVAKASGRPGAAESGFLARFRIPSRKCRIHLALQSAGLQFDLIDLDFNPAHVTRCDAAKIATYHEWLTCHETDLFAERGVSAELASLSYLPLISIVVPVLDVNSYLLTRCITSVSSQTYKNVEIFVANACTNPRVLRCLESAAADGRLTLLPCNNLAQLPEVLNHAVHAARGEFLALVHEDGELHSSALLEVVRRLNTYPNANLIYSDDDQIDVYGGRSNPSCKPDFDPDLILSSNYIGCLAVIRRSLCLDSVGVHALSEPVGHWDVLLRAIDSGGRQGVLHIAKPLYHRRFYDEITGVQRNGEPSSSFASCRAVVSEYLARSGETAATVEPGLPDGHIRVRYRHDRNTAVAAIVREVDGDFQETVLRAAAGKQVITFYGLLDCLLKPLSKSDGLAPDRGIVSLCDMREDVCLFINSALEAVNHHFIDELVSQAMRTECGVVTGISINV